MSKGIYVGVDNVARKVKNAFVGVEDTARKVKKGYIGVGGIARPFFSREPKLAYYGRLDDMLERSDYISTALADCALFTALEPGPEHLSSTVEVISSNLVWQDDIYIGGINEGEGSGTGSAVANVGDYAIFPSDGEGGDSIDVDYDSSGNPILDEGGPAGAVNSEFVVSYISGLADAVTGFSGASNGEYAVFHGGDWGGDSHNRGTAYDKNLTRHAFYANDYHVEGAAATRFSNYAVFAGGFGGRNDCVLLVDQNLVQTFLSPLSVGRENPSAAVTGEYLLIAGGSVQDESEEDVFFYAVDVIDIYDANLTKLTPAKLKQPKTCVGGASFADCAIFVGGKVFEYMPHNENFYSYTYSVTDVEVFDASLLRTEADALKEPRNLVAAQPLDNFLLLAGGHYSSLGGDTDGNGSDDDESYYVGTLEAYTFI